jgi:secreted trypsin-like serine protease
MDRTRKDQSILRGTTVSSNGPLAKSVVLIAQDIVYENGQPFFFGICTGLIISKRVVLTAAHCLDHGSKNTKIILNPTPRENLQANEIFRVIKAKKHPTYELRNAVTQNPLIIESFEETLGYNDVALLVTDRDFPQDKATPYNLMPTVQNTKPETALIAGFGKTTTAKETENFDFKSINGSLKQAYVTLNDESFLSGRILLTQKSEGGVCKGDSGAPLFVNEGGSRKLFAMAIGVFSKISQLDSDLNSVLLENECAGFGVYLILGPLQQWIITTEQQLRSASGLFEDLGI